MIRGYHSFRKHPYLLLLFLSKTETLYTLALSLPEKNKKNNTTNCGLTKKKHTLPATNIAAPGVVTPCYTRKSNKHIGTYPPWKKHSTWKWIIGRLVSFSDGLLAGANVGFSQCNLCNLHFVTNFPTVVQQKQCTKNTFLVGGFNPVGKY